MKMLHGQPVESRIQNKVLVLVHACVHNVGPPYLSEPSTHKLCSIERNAVEWATYSPSTDS